MFLVFLPPPQEREQGDHSDSVHLKLEGTFQMRIQNPFKHLGWSIFLQNAPS